MSDFFSSDSERFMLGFLICQGGIGVVCLFVGLV